MRMRSALGSFSGRAKLSWIFRSALGRGLANVPLAAAMEFESGEGAERGSLNGLSVTPTAGTHITCSCGCAPDTAQSVVFVSDGCSYLWVASSLIPASSNPGGPVGPLHSGPQTVLPFLPRLSKGSAPSPWISGHFLAITPYTQSFADDSTAASSLHFVVPALHHCPAPSPLSCLDLTMSPAWPCAPRVSQ